MASMQVSTDEILDRSLTPAAELVVAGETAEVEFKSSARYNQHTGQRDPKLELVIAKTIAAFANSAGGVLLIGVADDGSVLGLDNDYKFMKKPDNDRYELWLRDHLSVTLGADTAAAVRVDFPSRNRTANATRCPVGASTAPVSAS